MIQNMSTIIEVVSRYMPKNFTPKVGIILGSGLSSLAEQIVNPATIPYQAIPGLQSGSVFGHASLLMLGYLAEVPVVCLRGRLHLYEGISYDPIRILIRLLKKLGCDILIITGAVGGIREEATPGDLMLITDHIDMQPGNPLVGANDESVGPRFVSLDDAYDSDLQELMIDAANQTGIQLHKGVYLATIGPSFETPAEIRAFRQWGADAVGMSVVAEVILARHAGMRVVCLAAITNAAAGLSDEPITHEGTIKFGELAGRKLTKLIPVFLKNVNANMA